MVAIFGAHILKVFLQGNQPAPLEGAQFAQFVTIVQLKGKPCMLTSFGSQILLSNQNWASLCMIKTNGEI